MLNIVTDTDNGYRGCGPYRVGFRDGRITCTLYGGFYDSMPYDRVDYEQWKKEITEKMLQYADHIVKMDGSGQRFYFRNTQDASLVGSLMSIYEVPSAQGGMHTNLEYVAPIV